MDWTLLVLGLAALVACLTIVIMPIVIRLDDAPDPVTRLELWTSRRQTYEEFLHVVRVGARRLNEAELKAARQSERIARSLFMQDVHELIAQLIPECYAIYDRMAVEASRVVMHLADKCLCTLRGYAASENGDFKKKSLERLWKELRELEYAMRQDIQPGTEPVTRSLAARRLRVQFRVMMAARGYFGSVVLLLLLEALLFTLAWLGVRSLLQDMHDHAQLGPADAGAVVGSITALTTAIGTLIGAILMGLAKYHQARGEADANRIRAYAELERALGESARARPDLPSVVVPIPTSRSGGKAATAADTTTTAESEGH